MVSRRAVICAGVCGLTGACLASILWGMDEAMACTVSLDDDGATRDGAAEDALCDGDGWCGAPVEGGLAV